MLRFAANVREWMEADPQNVIAVHCKGGKGRTGTMICTWLVESGVFEQAKVPLCKKRVQNETIWILKYDTIT